MAESPFVAPGPGLADSQNSATASNDGVQIAPEDEMAVPNPTVSNNSTPIEAQPTALQAQQENEQLIKTLSAVEQTDLLHIERVVLLLRSASQAIQQLATEGDIEEAEEKFAENFQVYLQTLNEVQSFLRRIFRHLSKSGILAVAGKTIPFCNRLAGDEKDLELGAKRVALISAYVEEAIQEVKDFEANMASGNDGDQVPQSDAPSADEELSAKDTPTHPTNIESGVASLDLVENLHITEPPVMMDVSDTSIDHPNFPLQTTISSKDPAAPLDVSAELLDISDDDVSELD
ncbi:hypothetical protein DFS34DRAFT_588789 [Phlyctochytrium arcticum]|nr:hypothetical protein DFS34DRAFT_588789 [Phlyctochytrium arcticum]